MSNWTWAIKGYYTPEIILQDPIVGQWIFSLKEAAKKPQE